MANQKDQSIEKFNFFTFNFVTVIPWWIGMCKDLKEKICGAIVAAPTPATRDYEVDLDTYEENLEFIIEGGLREGVGCLMGAGGGGEGYFLNEKEWRDVIKTLAEVAGDKVPTMAGVFDLSAKHAIEKIKYAEDLGITFIQLAPPHYEKPTDIEVYRYYKMVDEAVSDIGIVVYHTYWAMPENYEMTLPLMTKICELNSVVGVKWASTNLTNFMNVLFTLKDKVSFIDNQGFVPLVKASYGMKAFMCFVGNYDPKTAVKLSNLFISGDYERYAEESKKASAFREIIRSEIVRIIQSTGAIGETGTLGEGTLGKTTMELAGRPCGPPFPPQFELTKKQKEEIRVKLEKEGLLPLK